MSKNIIFCFTGTGNSLKLSKDIACNIDECEVYAMRHENLKFLEEGLDRIGFIFPVYFGGLPNQVKTFISDFNLKSQKDTYLFSIATYGGACANALRQVNSVLDKKGIELQYSNKMKMMSNDILLYDIPKDNFKIDKKYKELLPVLCKEIKEYKKQKQANSIAIVNKYNGFMLKKVAESDKNYNVSEDCVSCGICKNVCPVDNIKLVNGKPVFEHKCEQCLACIHFCSKKAINYKNTTKKRGRYHNPEISDKVLKTFYNH